MVAFANPSTAMGAAGTTLGRLTPMADDVAIAAMKAHRHGANAVVRALPNKKKPDVSPIDTGLTVGEQATNILGFSPFLAMPASFAGKGVSWIGNKTGLKPITAAGSALGAPGRYLEKPIETTIFAKPVNAVATGLSKASGAVVGGISGFTGLDKRLQASHLAKSKTRLEKARELMKEVNISDAPAAIHSELHELKGMAHAQSLTAAQAERAITLIERTEKGLAAAEGKGLGKAYAKAAKHMEAAAGHQLRAVHWADPRASIAAAPAKLQKMDAGHTLMQGAWVLGSGISMAQDARTFSRNLDGLKTMYHDMTGKQLSTTGALFGTLPPVLAAARSHMIKNTSIKEITDAAGLLVNLKGLFNPRFNGLKAAAAFMIPGFAAQGADMIMGESIIPAYEAMKANFDAKQKMPQDYYAAFLGELSPELKKRGGAGSAFTKAVAAQYATEQATPEQILREINDGKLMTRIKAVIAQQGQQHPADHKAQPRTVMGKHTEKVIQAAAQPSQSTGHAVT
ncbi:MAG: hypothetical protein AB7L92_07205 [Alphaproteobacteria bacterium]